MKIFCAVGVALVAMASLLEAKPVAIPYASATLDIPEGWMTKPSPNPTAVSPAVLLIVGAPDTDSALEVYSMDNADGIAADSPSFIDGVQKGIARTATGLKATVQMGSVSTLTLGGAPASCVQYTETTPGGKPVICRTYAVAANRKLYSIVSQAVDPAQDATLAAIATSLTFDSPVTVPTGENTAEKYGEIVGRCIAVVAVFATFRWLFRRKKT